jgi:hypothetical protein
MKKTNLFFTAFAMAIILTVGLACKSFSSTQTEVNTAKTTTAPEIANKDSGKSSNNSTSGNTDSPKVEKADFTVTSEEFDKEFSKKGAKESDLEKYASKNIAVTGRVSMIVTEKKGTVQPWVTLYAPGILNGVNCYFDDDNLEQMKQLKMDKVVKVQGFKDSFIVPEVPPTLDHCVVLEADK